MDKLLATPNMMRLAAEDVPTIEYYGYSRSYKSEKYKRGMYMRCRVQDGILKVAFFAPQHMRMGGKKPVYELYVDKEKKQFLTLDCQNNKWRTATLRNLIWYSSTSYFQSGEKWISREGKKVLRNYFCTEEGDFNTIVKFQNDVRDEELKLRHKKETDPWDEDLLQTPSLPKDWDRWKRKVGIPEQYMFYQYTRRKYKTGYCTFCEKEVPIRKPRHNTMGTCPCCRHKVTYKAIGRAGTVMTKTHTMYLMQRCKDGFMVREFSGWCKYRQGEYNNPESYVHETYRIIFNADAKIQRSYYWGVYKQTESRWIKGGTHFDYSWGNYEGSVYGKTIPSLHKKELKMTGLPEYIKGIGGADPTKYLSVYNSYPFLEKFVKAGLTRLSYEYLYDTSVRYNLKVQSGEQSLVGLLGINNMELKRLRKNDGGIKFLQWLQFEKASGTLIPDDVISWFCEVKIEPRELKFIWNKMSPVAIRNYISRQMKELHESSHSIINTWSDYLSMAKRLGMDTNDEIIFRVRKLRQRHDELVERCQEKDLAIRAGEILEKYPRVEEVFTAIRSKYEYSDNDYMIMVPSCIEDMLREGRNLHHCVADSDRYFDRINRQEAYVLFLRRTSAPEKSFYTLEIEPGGTVRQKRTMYDRQEKDIEQATDFLRKWQKEISVRLTESDKQLARQSKILRHEEFEQLRKDQVVVHTGNLAGKLLVDVLMQDLLEAA
ncbi:MAG: PcfJ domain-containing protein [Acutalibacteraceae bacterium]